MPESTRKRTAAKAAAEPEPAATTAPAATKTAKAVKPAPAEQPGRAAAKATKAAKSAKAEAPAAEEPIAAADGDADTDEADEFLNRAARRAKGRGRSGGQQPVTGRGPSFAGRGAVPGQRQWGNRRTGG